jgi:hypothetical protein
MMGGIEDLWQSAGDGAFSPVGALRSDGDIDMDIDALMNAWFRERQDSIECRLYLEEAGRLLQKMVAVDTVPPGLRRRALCLLRAVHRSKRPGDDHA